MAMLIDAPIFIDPTICLVVVLSILINPSDEEERIRSLIRNEQSTVFTSAVCICISPRGSIGLFILVICIFPHPPSADIIISGLISEKHASKQQQS